MKIIRGSACILIAGALAFTACRGARSVEERGEAREESAARTGRARQRTQPQVRTAEREAAAQARRADERDLRNRHNRLEARYDSAEVELERIDEFLAESIQRDLDRTEDRLDELAEAEAMDPDTWNRLRRDLELDLSRLEGDILEAEQRIATVKRQ